MQKAHAERIQKVRMMQQQAQLMRQNRDVATPPPPATRQQIQPVAAPHVPSLLPTPPPKPSIMAYRVFSSTSTKSLKAKAVDCEQLLPIS